MGKRSKKFGFAIRHFSQSNGRDESMEDVPRLLRRVADSIESLGPGVRVQDIVFHEELDDDTLRWWPSMTVYFHPPEKSEDHRKG